MLNAFEICKSLFCLFFFSSSISLVLQLNDRTVTNK